MTLSEQKNTNQDYLLKRSAFEARCEAFRKAHEDIRKHPKSVVLRMNADAARKAEKELRGAYNSSIRELQQQIAEIEARISDIIMTRKPLIEAAAKRRYEACKALYRNNEEIYRSVRAQFLDIRNANGSFDDWVPPDGYIEAYAAMRDAESAPKAAP